MRQSIRSWKITALSFTLMEAALETSNAQPLFRKAASGPCASRSLKSKGTGLFNRCQEFLIKHGEGWVRREVQTVKASVSSANRRGSRELRALWVTRACLWCLCALVFHIQIALLPVFTLLLETLWKGFDLNNSQLNSFKGNNILKKFFFTFSRSFKSPHYIYTAICLVVWELQRQVSIFISLLMLGFLGFFSPKTHEDKLLQSNLFSELACAWMFLKESMVLHFFILLVREEHWVSLKTSQLRVLGNSLAGLSCPSQ